MKHSLTALLAILALACPAAAVEMKGGKWQVTMKNSNGTKEGTSEFTMTNCMTADEVNAQGNTSAAVPGAKKNEDYETSGKDGDCTYKAWQKGNVSHMESECNGEKSVTDATNNAEDYTMKSVVTNKEGSMTSEISGKRVGDC